MDMILDGGNGDDQMIGDLLVAESARYQLGDLSLAPREARENRRASAAWLVDDGNRWFPVEDRYGPRRRTRELEQQRARQPLAVLTGQALGGASDCFEGRGIKLGRPLLVLGHP